MKLSIPSFILATLFADAYAMPASGTVAIKPTVAHPTGSVAIGSRAFAPRGNDDIEYKEAFAFFETPGTASVPRETLGGLLRAVGQNPTQSEVDNIVNAASAQVNFDEFLRIVNRPDGFANEGTKKEMVERASKAFDKDGDGKIGGPQLRYVLMRLGNKMIGAEEADMFSMAAGELEYEPFLADL
ncbi:hypothetical protein C8J57DRAFT_1565702 [Mycena rebaudengoi]|nr:hypothetical protein C8J57DRAFT_1565702 [Mycena rebaudengoi]